MVEHSRVLLAAVAFVAVGVDGGGRSAAERAGKERRVSEELGGLKWGATKADVVAKHQGTIEAGYGKRLSTVTDPLTMDRLRRERDEEIAGLARSIVKLEGKRTGYEVSVIEGEFRANAGEELFVPPWSSLPRRYYLFRNDKLVKVIVVFKLGSGAKRTPFTEFIDTLKRRYGKPRQFEYTGSDESEITAAEWSDGASRMTVKDRSDVYLAYTVVLTDERERVGVVAPPRPEPERDSAIGELFRETP